MFTVLVIPLPSVICKQFRRSLYIADGWRQKLDDDANPSDFGWVDSNSGVGEECWVVDIQDLDDPYYSKPLEIVKGCSCKNQCTKCNCKKTDLRDKRCTPVTCRSCGCFDRNSEQSDDDTCLSSSTEFSTDTESDGMAEPLINFRRDFISSDEEY